MRFSNSKNVLVCQSCMVFDINMCKICVQHRIDRQIHTHREGEREKLTHTNVLARYISNTAYDGLLWLKRYTSEYSQLFTKNHKHTNHTIASCCIVHMFRFIHVFVCACNLSSELD